MNFRPVFDENVSWVWLSLRRLGIPDSDRDDATQEVFMTAHALLDDFDSSRPLRPWLFGITYRIALRHRRRLGRNPTAADPIDMASTEPNAEEALASHQARALVAKAIGSIEIHRRAVFIMKEIDGVAVPEIAKTLDLPVNTAYSRLRLAREDFEAAVKRMRLA